MVFVREVVPPLESLLRRLTPASADPYDLAAEALARAYSRWTQLGTSSTGPTTTTPMSTTASSPAASAAAAAAAASQAGSDG